MLTAEESDKDHACIVTGVGALKGAAAVCNAPCNVSTMLTIMPGTKTGHSSGGVTATEATPVSFGTGMVTPDGTNGNELMSA